MKTHEDHTFIEELFYQQMRRLTVEATHTFDVQFSDAWI